MKTYKSVIIGLFLLGIPLFGQTEFFVNMTYPDDLENPQGNLEYLIEPGDCLWILADKFYNDPWRWPEIFDANSYIINPHWIFYDNWLVIPGFTMEQSIAETHDEDETVVSESDTLDIYSDSGSESDSEMTEKTWGLSETETGAEAKADSQQDAEIRFIKEEVVEIPAETVRVTALGTEGNETFVKKEGYSQCSRTGFSLGFQVGYPLMDLPNEEEDPNYGLFIGTPLGVEIGPLDLGIGVAILTYDFSDIYPGVGLLANLCLNDLLQINSSLKFQLGGGVFYVVGGDLGAGGGTAVNMPLGNSPFSLRLYAAAGTYQDESNEVNNWGNTGVLLMYSL